MSQNGRADASSTTVQDGNEAETSKNVVESVTARKQPPAEMKESIWVRRGVIFSFWAVVIFIGLPIWWKTTAIYRANLPLQVMTDWADGKV